ncbi:MAG TPA: hypothetical protein VHO66_08165 [Ruminiclostridium sp.]|nr:hypothetical protein [Ruminiclostridium sp.]
MADVNDIVQFQANDTENTDTAFREFYKLSFADKLDAIYELLCQIGGNEIKDGETILDGPAAEIQNGYDSACFTIGFKERIFGEENVEELPG